ncbi:tetratricopeptide repeat protein [Methylocystis sp. JR02]|uniref:tetratricopeptide repeat protein n=1 Tax=Methylocystis sp. JR02 TaxID=3046284 RepID=UPI0024BAA02E|nr:tetratricopeptide repeat protein [Methylocystis sp. JR02]MDJ0448328.1 tetratricopeptide repeat protein [Methylocystis sp. JR02]
MCFRSSITSILLWAWLTPTTLAADRDPVECKEGKDKNQIIDACTRLIRKGDDLESAYFHRGLAYSRSHYDRAIADVTEAIRINPANGPLYSARGNVYKWKGDYARAIADFSEAIRVAPEEAKDGSYQNPREALHFLLGYNLYERGIVYFADAQLDRAIGDFTAALRHRMRPFLEAMVFEARSKTYSAKGEVHNAIADHTEAMRLDPRVATKDVFRIRPPGDQ